MNSETDDSLTRLNRPSKTDAGLGGTEGREIEPPFSVLKPSLQDLC